MRIVKYIKHLIPALLLLPVLFVGAQESKQVVVKFDIREEIAPSATRIASKALDRANELNAAAVIIHMNTFGGLLADGDSIRTAILNSPVPVYVFVDKNAASAGALIAIACDRIYMAPGASIGSATVVDGEGKVLPDKYQSYMRSIMRSTAESHGRDTIISQGDTVIKYRRDPMIAEAMVDPRTVIPGLIDSTKVLAFTPQEAIANAYCEGEATSVREVLEKAGLKDYKIEEVTKSGMDKVIGFLANPMVSGVLITFIFAGIFFELRTPGVGFPLLAAGICALLYFAPLYLEGLAANWEIILFIVGLVLIGVEIFAIPGFGVAGVSGIVLVVISLVLSLIRNVQFDFSMSGSGEIARALAVVLFALVAFMVLAFIFGKGFLKTGLFQRIVQSHTLEQAKVVTDTGSFQADLTGAEGVCHTDLKPMGKVRIEGRILDAKTLGDFAAKDSPVRVVGREFAYLLVESI